MCSTVTDGCPPLHPSNLSLWLFRLWWEKPGVFTRRQQASLASASLSRIICDNTAINTVPVDVFETVSNTNRMVSCSRIRRLNLLAWRETRCTGWTFAASIRKKRCHFRFVLLILCVFVPQVFTAVAYRLVKHAAEPSLTSCLRPVRW